MGRGGVDVKGFGLVDVVVSLVIVAVGILALTAMTGVIGQRMRVARIETQIAALARGEMERLLGTDPAALESGSRVAGDYRVAWDVSDGPPRHLRLIVGYDDGGRIARADTLATLMRGSP